jgi:hypothetical protein
VVFVVFPCGWKVIQISSARFGGAAPISNSFLTKHVAKFGHTTYVVSLSDSFEADKIINLWTKLSELQVDINYYPNDNLSHFPPGGSHDRQVSMPETPPYGGGDRSLGATTLPFEFRRGLRHEQDSTNPWPYHSPTTNRFEFHGIPKATGIQITTYLFGQILWSLRS